MDWLTLQGSLAILSTWGYVLLLPLAIIEGPIIGIFAGFLVALGQMNWLIVFVVLFVGDMIGDVIYYYIGRWGHGAWATRLAARFGMTPERLEKFNEAFNKHAVKILLINKTQALGSLTLYYAGAVRMPMVRFLWVNAVGTIPKVILFEVVGYYFGESYQNIDKYLGYAGWATLAIPVLLLVGYWLFRLYSKKNNDVEGLV
ncbi:MAG TPA: DedA family protein [Candidatus Paceibacterota bacterium]|jgi:membrane protein DedA with SNARE-associated domain|nr:DedA family protein [Candidatus Paceibacterota bacterium]